MNTATSVNYDQWLNKLNELPTLPAIVYELSRIISNPMSSTRDIERVMENDQSLTMKVLKLVNSAYYAIPGGVSNLSRAIAYIGFDTLHQLVLSSSIIDALGSKVEGTFSVNKFWQHSVGVGIASENIAKFINYRTPADLFTCGLVHDIGKIAVLMIDKELTNKISGQAVAENASMYEVETNNTAYPRHTDLGYMLSKKWRLPAQIQMVIRYHHESDPARRAGASSEMNSIIDIIFVGNLLIQAMKFGNSGHNKILPIQKSLFDRLGIQATNLKNLTLAIQDGLKKADSFIQLIGDK